VTVNNIVNGGTPNYSLVSLKGPTCISWVIQAAKLCGMTPTADRVHALAAEYILTIAVL
jgi:hypothetical protein